MKRVLFNIGIGIVMIWLLSACDTKQDWFDTGISSPYHDGSIMDYLRKDTANWQLTVVLIEQAGLTSLFEGQDAGYQEITFFAPPSFAVLRFVWDRATGREQFPYEQDKWRSLTVEEREHPERLVQALDPDWCRKMVLRHVVKGKILKKDIAFRDRDYDIADDKQTGGTGLVCESGNRVLAYREKTDYGAVADAGAVHLYLYSFDAMQMVPLASPDIQPNNGVVHALNYNYELGKI